MTSCAYYAGRAQRKADGGRMRQGGGAEVDRTETPAQLDSEDDEDGEDG